MLSLRFVLLLAEAWARAHDPSPSASISLHQHVSSDASSTPVPSFNFPDGAMSTVSENAVPAPPTKNSRPSIQAPVPSNLAKFESRNLREADEPWLSPSPSPSPGPGYEPTFQQVVVFIVAAQRALGDDQAGDSTTAGSPFSESVIKSIVVREAPCCIDERDVLVGPIQPGAEPPYGYDREEEFSGRRLQDFTQGGGRNNTNDFDYLVILYPRGNATIDRLVEYAESSQLLEVLNSELNIEVSIWGVDTIQFALRAPPAPPASPNFQDTVSFSVECTSASRMLVENNATGEDNSTTADNSTTVEPQPISEELIASVIVGSAPCCVNRRDVIVTRTSRRGRRLDAQIEEAGPGHVNLKSGGRGKGSSSGPDAYARASLSAAVASLMGYSGRALSEDSCGYIYDVIIFVRGNVDTITLVAFASSTTFVEALQVKIKDPIAVSPAVSGQLLAPAPSSPPAAPPPEEEALGFLVQCETAATPGRRLSEDEAATLSEESITTVVVGAMPCCVHRRDVIVTRTNRRGRRLDAAADDGPKGNAALEDEHEKSDKALRSRLLSETTDPCDFDYDVLVFARSNVSTEALLTVVESPAFLTALNILIVITNPLKRLAVSDVTIRTLRTPSPLAPPNLPIPALPPFPPPFPPPYPPRKHLKFDPQRADPNRHFIH